MLRWLKISGALMSYHCFLVNGSTLQNQRKHTRNCISGRRREEQREQILDRGSAENERGGGGTHAFFLEPFLPLDILLFFPTAMVAAGSWCGGAAASGG
jgi:hypothetical protein